MKVLTKIVNWLEQDSFCGLVCNNLVTIVLMVILLGVIAVTISRFTKSKRLYKMFF